VVGGVRRLEAGQLEHALVDGRQRHEGGFSGLQTVARDADLDGRGRSHVARRFDGQAEGARPGVEPQPGEPDGPPRPPFGRILAERGGQNVGADAPGFAERDLDGGPRRRNVHVVGLDQLVVGDRQQDVAVERRLDVELGHLAGPVGGVVGDHLQVSGRSATDAAMYQPAWKRRLVAGA
jgi:hypothetical protein